MNLVRELHHLIDDSLSDDPRIALSSCRQLTRDQLPWLTDRAVMSARRSGWSWSTVGKLCGISAQAARLRFKRLDALVPPVMSPEQQQWGDDGSRAFYAQLGHERRADDLRTWEVSGTDIVPW